VKLLRAIGSPFVSERYLPKDGNIMLELYAQASKNKIGLLYLHTLKEHGLEQLKEICKVEKEKQRELLTTALRFSKLLNNLGADYAIFKSIPLYPHVPNDVDIILFDDSKKFENIINFVLKNGYKIIGEVPLETWLHDLRKEDHMIPGKKDVYDIDLYRELGAVNIIYLDKTKLKKYVAKTKLFGENIKVLRPGMELAVIVMHSVFPEQIFTLHLYYATLHYLSKMNAEDIKDFISIAKENNITFAVKTVISLIAILHEAAHGFIPEKLKTLTSELRLNNFETNKLQKKLLKTPHKYMFLTIIITLLEKMREKKAAKSILWQMLKMSNPKTIWYVAGVVIERRRRETY